MRPPHPFRRAPHALRGTIGGSTEGPSGCAPPRAPWRVPSHLPNLLCGTRNCKRFGLSPGKCSTAWRLAREAPETLRNVDKLPPLRARSARNGRVVCAPSPFRARSARRGLRRLLSAAVSRAKRVKRSATLTECRRFSRDARETAYSVYTAPPLRARSARNSLQGLQATAAWRAKRAKRFTFVVASGAQR